jgi:hypothetical protein
MSAFMDFGKHKGKPVSAVPSDYLLWALHEARCISPWLREAIEEELQRRVEAVYNPEENSNLPARLNHVIDRWYRGLVMDYHPDRGGSHEAMQAVNDAHDRLRQMVGAA